MKYRYRVLYSESGPIGICYEADGRLLFAFTRCYWLETPKSGYWKKYKRLHTMFLEDVAGQDLYEEVRRSHLALLFGDIHWSPALD